MTTATDATATLVQFTDPMCTWCWGSEPVLRRLRTAYGEQVRFEFVMGGLVEEFDDFSNPANGISDPGDVGPHWTEASAHHGMPVDTAIFDENPARSTYPASVAFAAPRRQDRTLGHRYLRRLREAYATEVRNVNRRAEQVRIAESVGLDVDRFVADVESGRAREAFEADLRRTRGAEVRSFPTYDLRGPEGERRAVGFQSFEDLRAALSAVAPSLTPRDPPALRTFVAEYGPVATREAAEVYDLDDATAREALRSLADEGVVAREPRGNGVFWRSATGA